MMNRIRLFFVVLLVMAVGETLVAQQPRPPVRRLEIADQARIVNVADPQISPDGKWIACVVSRPNVADNRTDSEIILVDVASASQRPLTYNRRGAGSPRWSPKGDRIAFLATVGSGRDAHLEIFVLPMSGGDAVQITRGPSGVEQFAWRPDGRDIAYVTADEPPNKEEIAKHLDAFEVGNDDYLSTAAPTPSHVWLTSSAGGSAKRLTSGAWSLPKTHPPGAPVSPLSWSPDGKRLLYTRQATPHYGDNDQSAIYELDVAGGNARKLTSHTLFEGFGDYSPDGNQIAYRYPRDGDRGNGREVLVTATSGGDGSEVTRGIDRNLARSIWMPDGKSLLVGAHDGTQTSLWIQTIGGNAKRLDLGEISPSWSFWVEMDAGPDGAIAFAGSTATWPNELYYMKSAGAEPKRLTTFNRAISQLQLGAVERIEWTSDGFRCDGVVTYPPGFSRSKKYPLVLYIHGGPTAASIRSFSLRAQAFAAHDYIVFEPNYRGSDNLGSKFQHAIFQDAGAGPGRDVMAGIEELMKLGNVDKDKIAVSGWSYGGYMTTWMIGHYNIWKTAVAGASVTNLVDQYNLADFNATSKHSHGGSPWNGDFLEAYLKQSPITYASAMKTPTLILSDTGDARVTITQSYYLYHALKDNGVPTKFFAYPVAGHFPADPVRSMDVSRRWLEWLDQYLK